MYLSNQSLMLRHNFRRLFQVIASLIFLCFPLFGCTALSVNKKVSKVPTTTWRLCSQQTPRGTVTLLPGLNTKANAMIPLAEYLRDQGFHSIILNYQDHGLANKTAWNELLGELQTFLELNYPTLPKFVLGYSLGTLITLNALLDETIVLDGMILLAPAIELQSYSYLPSYLTWLKVYGLELPSGAPKSYRARDSTSLSTYDQLYSLQKKISSHAPSTKLSQVPALVVVHEDDELVSPEGISEWILKNSYDWKIVLLQGENKDSDLPRHITLDRQSLGNNDWRLLQEEIALFLNTEKSSSP